jgi:nuclear pore complex protein Nup205
MTAQQREELAGHRLNALLEAKQREMQSFLYIIETALYILWCHLEFFFVQCMPKPTDDQLGLATSTPMMRRLQDPGWMARQSAQCATTAASIEGVSRNDIEQLKAEAISSFTDAFFKNLLDVERSREQKGFVDALTRRIKRLLKLRI